MPPLNFQRFITVFVIIAVFSSTLMLGISGYTSRKTEKKAQSRGSSLNGPFVERLASAPQDPTITALEARLKENATEKVAGILAAQILQKNPDGPVQGVDGLQIMMPGGWDKLVENYVAQEGSFPADILKIEIDEKNLNIGKSSNVDSIIKYLSETSQMVSDASSLSTDAVTEGDPQDVLNKSLKSIQETTKKLRGTEIPKELVDFHKAVLGSMEVSSAYTRLIEIDPMGAAILGDTYAKELSKYVNKVSTEAEKISSLEILASTERNVLQKIAGIQTAHAQLTDFAAIAQRIIMIAGQVKDFVLKYQEIIKEILVEFLKNTLLREMTRQVVNWASGGGKPQFVTNWNTFAEGAVNQAAGAVIGEIAPKLCGSPQDIGNIVGLGKVSDFIRKITQPIDFVNSTMGYPSCTLDRAITNINDFQQDLRNGGWLGYTAMLEPQNTFFGSIIAITERQMAAAYKAKDEAVNKAVAGKGYVGQEVCDDGTKPGEYKPASAGGPHPEANTLEGKFAKAYADGGGCADNSKPQVTTPGANTADLTSKSFDAAYDRLITAKDYKALAAYVANAALNRLVQKGVTGLLSAVGGRRGSSGGGTNSSAPPVEQPSSNVAELAGQILARKKSSLSDLRTTEETLTETINILQQTAMTCTTNPAVTEDAKAQIQMLAPFRDSITLKILELRPKVDELQSMVNNMPARYTVANLTAQFGTLATAQTEAEEMSTQRINAEGVFSSAGNLFSSCSSGVINSPPPTEGEPDPEPES